MNIYTLCSSAEEKPKPKATYMLDVLSHTRRSNSTSTKYLNSFFRCGLCTLCTVGFKKSQRPKKTEQRYCYFLEGLFNLT